MTAAQCQPVRHQASCPYCAGDALISALVSYLLLGYDKVRAARIATYAAGLSTTRQGVIPALVDRETLEAFVAKRDAGLLG